MSRRQRLTVAAGAVVAAVAFVWLLRQAAPELGTGKAEATWAPGGVGALLSRPGLLALALAAAALVLLVLALRPGRRALPATFFDEAEKRTIQAAIAAAEDRTSGEIRVHLARRTAGEARAAAAAAFHELGMDATAARNGVLVYLSVQDHRFAIVGDVGINSVVPEGFWDEIKEGMQARFAAGRFAEGIAEAAGRIGEKLHAFFPIQADDVNELPDEISTED